MRRACGENAMSVLTVKQQCYGKPDCTPALNPDICVFLMHSSNCHSHTKTKTNHRLRLRESLGESLDVSLEVAVVGEELHVGTVDLDAAGGLLLQVLLAAQRGEAPVLGDDDLLATGELVLGSAEGLEGVGAVYREMG